MVLPNKDSLCLSLFTLGVLSFVGVVNLSVFFLAQFGWWAPLISMSIGSWLIIRMIAKISNHLPLLADFRR